MIHWYVGCQPDDNGCHQSLSRTTAVPDSRSVATARNYIYWYAFFFKHLKHADMRRTACATTRQDQADFGSARFAGHGYVLRGINRLRQETYRKDTNGSETEFAPTPHQVFSLILPMQGKKLSFCVHRKNSPLKTCSDVCHLAGEYRSGLTLTV